MFSGSSHFFRRWRNAFLRERFPALIVLVQERRGGDDDDDDNGGTGDSASGSYGWPGYTKKIE